MKQAQWIVIGAAILLFGVLSILPKHVVENDAIAVGEAELKPEVEESHAGSISAEDMVAIAVAKNNYLKADAQGKPAMLDSLIVKFILANRYDSAAQYAEEYALDADSEVWKERAGELYYEAFTFALSEDKAAAMASKAQALLKPIVDADPSKYDLRVKLGTTYISTSAPMQGILMIRGVLKDDPKNLFALMQLGLLSMRSGQYDKAIDRFNSVLEIKEEVEALYYLGIAHAELEHHQEAEEALQRARKLATDASMVQTIDQYLKDLASHEHD